MGSTFLFILGFFADNGHSSPVMYAYAEVPSTDSGDSEYIDSGTNCNSSAPGATSSNGDDGDGDSADGDSE